MDGESRTSGMYLLSDTAWHVRANDRTPLNFWRTSNGASLHDTLVSLASYGTLPARYDEHEDGSDVWSFAGQIEARL